MKSVADQITEIVSNSGVSRATALSGWMVDNRQLSDAEIDAVLYPRTIEKDGPQLDVLSDEMAALFETADEVMDNPIYDNA